MTDQPRDAKHHGAGVAALIAVPVYLEPHVELLHFRYLISSDQPGAKRTECVAALPLHPLPAVLELKGAFGHVVDDQIARHMIERTLDRHASRDIANYNPEFDFPVSTLRAKGNYDVVVGPTDRKGRFHENH